MGIEVALETTVGDLLPAAKAQLILIVTDPPAPLATVVVSRPNLPTVTFTQGTHFTGGVGDDAAAEEIRALIASVSGLEATRVLSAITVKAATAGLAGNSITVGTSDIGFLGLTSSPASLIGGRDENAGYAMRIWVDDDELFHLSLGGVEVAKANWKQLDFDNTESLVSQFAQFFRAVQN